MYTWKLAILVTLCSFLITHGVRDIHLSQEEEISLDKEFQQLRKSSIKIIQNAFGDVYDCVDFYMQPAFDHPLLKNHTFHPEMRPSIIPKHTIFSDKLIHDIKLKNGGCPTGTIPIRRVDENEFNRIKRFTEKYTNSNTRGPNPETHFAMLRTNSDPHITKYYGAEIKLSVHNLSIGPSQYSSAQLIIQNGDDKVKVGWTVNPTLNKDGITRLFQYLDAGESHCFNALCPGYVHTNKDVPIDATLTPTSIRGREDYYIQPHIFKDDKTGHWWLEITNITFGFWPKEIFKTMSTSASYVAVGGEAYGPPNQPLPPMGNGYYPVDDILKSAYCSNFVILDKNHMQIIPQNTDTYSDDWHYGVYDEGILGEDGRVMYYGGTTLWI